MTERAGVEGQPHASANESDMPIVVQHTSLDGRWAEITLLLPWLGVRSGLERQFVGANQHVGRQGAKVRRPILGESVDRFLD